MKPASKRIDRWAAAREPSSSPDLAGYTALTEVQGNHRAAEIAQAFCARVCSIEEEHGARDVKTVGDAVMAHASAADEAILLRSEERRVGKEWSARWARTG